MGTTGFERGFEIITHNVATYFLAVVCIQTEERQLYYCHLAPFSKYSAIIIHCGNKNYIWKSFYVCTSAQQAMFHQSLPNIPR